MLLAAAKTATDSTAPWWGSGVFVVGAALVTAVVTWLISQRTRTTTRKEAERTMRRDSVVSLMTSMHQLLATTTAKEQNDLSAGLYTALITCQIVNPQLKDEVAQFYDRGRELVDEENTTSDSPALTAFRASEDALMSKMRQKPRLYGLP